MIKVIITKYSGGSRAFGINYFDPTNLTVEDYLIINDLPQDSFPLFTDELLRDENSVYMVSSEYDLVLDLLDTSIKSNIGKTVNEFFQFGITLDVKKVLRIVVNVDGIDKLIGFIDITSFDFNYNWIGDDSQFLKFTVYSAEIEFIKAMRQKSYKELSNTYGNSYDGQNFWMFVQYMCSFFNTYNSLHPNPLFVSIGVGNKLSPIHKMFFNKSCDEVWVNLLKGFGLLFKIFKNDTHPDRWDTLNVRIFNRQYGTGFGNTVNIDDTLDHHELRTTIQDNLLYFGIPYTQINSGVSTEGTNYSGIVAGKNDSGHIEYVDIRFYPSVTPTSTQRLWLFIKDGLLPFGIWNICGKENLKLIDLDMVEKDISVFASFYQFIRWDAGANIEKLSFCRAFVKNYNIESQGGFGGITVVYTDEGADLVAKEFINTNTYMYLINGIERVKELKILNEIDFSILAFNNAIFDGQEYNIERVSNINLNDKSYNVKLVRKY